MDHYLAKPVREQDLRQALERIPARPAVPAGLLYPVLVQPADCEGRQ